MDFLKFGQEKKRNYTKIVSLLVFKARSDAVWVYKWGTLSLASPCEGKDYKHSGDKLQSSIGMKSSTLSLASPRSEGLYSLMKLAPMQYRHEIEHAPANLALQRY